MPTLTGGPMNPVMTSLLTYLPAVVSALVFFGAMLVRPTLHRRRRNA
jgi:hypothetical protein